MASNVENLFVEWLQLIMCAKLLKVGVSHDDFKNRLSKVAKLYGKLNNAEQGEFSELIADYNEKLQQYGELK